MDPRSIPCIFVGYSATQSAYYCLDPVTHKIYTSRHVQFVETEFPYTKLSSTTSIPTYPTSDSWCQVTVPILPSGDSTTRTNDTPLEPFTSPATVHPSDTSSSSQSNLVSSPLTHPPEIVTNDSLSDQTHSQTSTTHLRSIVTRSQNNIFRPNPKYANPTTVQQCPTEPNTITQALTDPLWKQAMLDEIKALHHLWTWELVPANSGQNVVKCKWVFRIKYKPDGTVERYRARLVAKGFQQRMGVDYTETF
ncbi:retrovirus-related pol polyprotein from transposon RE1, partial [Tanacetum coccineum]